MTENLASSWKTASSLQILLEIFPAILFVLRLLLLWWNTVTRARWGGKGWFGLHFHILVNHWKRSGQELKKSRNLEAGDDAGAMEGTAYWLASHGLLSPAMVPLTMDWDFPINLLLRKCPLQDCLLPDLGETFSHLRFPRLRWLELVSRWYKLASTYPNPSSFPTFWGDHSHSHLQN